MLKLSLEKNKSLDRHLEAATKHLAKLVEEASRQGWARVSVYPRAGSLFAGAAIFSALASVGVRVVFRVSLEPPPRVSIPTVLIGYGSLSYGSSSVESPLVAVSDKLEGSPPPGALFLDGDASSTGIVGLLLHSMGGLYVRRDIMSIIVAGLYYGGKMDKQGRLYGLDQVLLERITRSGALGDLEVVTSLKSYMPHQYPVCKSVAVTVNPYYPGLTGDVEECSRTLHDMGLERLLDKPLAMLDEKSLKQAIKAILSRIAEELDEDIDVTEYVGGIIVSRRERIGDYRMIADAILNGVDWSGTPEPLLGAASSYEEEVTPLARALEEAATRIAEIETGERPRRVKGPSWLRLYTVEAGGVSQLFLQKALSLSGRIPRDALIVYQDGDDYTVSTLQVEEVLGPGEARKLKNIRVAEGDGLVLRLRLRG